MSDLAVYNVFGFIHLLGRGKETEGSEIELCGNTVSNLRTEQNLKFGIY